METLILRGDDVETLLEMKDVMKAVEECFKEKGLSRVQMPPKQYLYYSRHDGDLRVMPAYLESLDTSGVKIVTSHPKNPVTSSLPTVMATFVLVDPKTGFPLCIMDATMITAMRTGAAGTVAAKYLARDGSKTLGLVGAGVQAHTQFMALAELLKIEEAYVYDKDLKTAATFMEKMTRIHPKVSFRVVEDERKAVKGMDIVVTSTPSRTPHVRKEWISPGTHINAIGADAPGKQELEPEILKMGKLVVDDRKQAYHSGEVNVPLSQKIVSEEDIYCELGDIVAGKALGRISDQEVTIFDSTGLAIQDVAAADLVYRKALRLGVGLRINLISPPHF